ncbi:hypothetical protein, partial [Escherichia coli]
MSDIALTVSILALVAVVGLFIGDRKSTRLNSSHPQQSGG